jgi:hypothetical protein
MCPDCEIATADLEYRMFTPKCVYCGARLLRKITGVRQNKEQKSARMTKVLQDWVAYGHSEEQIRRLYKSGPYVEPKGKKK